MKNKIFFCQWTDMELLDRPRCSCDCHSHPGTYPTNPDSPCHVCQHVNEYGYFPKSDRDGWVEYWRTDKVREYANQQ